MTLSRTLLALLIVGAVAAADSATVNPASVGVEVFTLADGRRLVGTYDPVSGLLRIVGAVPAAIRVEPEAIVSHRPAEAADLPVDRPTTAQERSDRQRAAATGALAASHRASAERETMLIIAGRRQAAAEQGSATAQAAIGDLDARLKAIAEDRREVQSQRDHLANQRALTDLHISTITITNPPPSVPGIPAAPPSNGPTQTLSELTATLTAANRRLAELDTRLAANDGNRATALAQRAEYSSQQRTAQAAAAQQAARITALTEQQTHAITERARFTATLASDQAPPAVPTP